VSTAANSTVTIFARMRIAVIGCNHRTAPLELRERVAFTPQQALRAVDELRENGVVDEAVVISTCNRSELYGVSPRLAIAAEDDSVSGETPDALEQYFSGFHGLRSDDLQGRLYRQTNTRAVEHLFRVTSGLDSMLIGEAEILGQVRDAYQRALEHGSTGPVLNRLFQGALEVGKRVRAETEVGTRPMSVAWAGVRLAERVFGKLDGHGAVILGSGTVAEQVLEHLKNRGIKRLMVLNRSRDRADELARRMSAESDDWSSLENSLAWPDIIVASTSAAEPVLTKEVLERVQEAREGRSLFVIDLGVPRNVAADAAKLYNLYLYNLDDLGEIVEQNRKAREAEIPRAESIISEHIGKFESWCASVEAVSVSGKLRERLMKERTALLDERAKELAGLSEEDRARILKITEELIERVVKQPGERLHRTRELPQRLAGIEALRRLFGLEGEDS
jgi:glutamyl-tRNA reductase